jgi:hypothetical protein
LISARSVSVNIVPPSASTFASVPSSRDLRTTANKSTANSSDRHVPPESSLTVIARRVSFSAIQFLSRPRLERNHRQMVVKQLANSLHRLIEVLSSDTIFLANVPKVSCLFTNGLDFSLDQCRLNVGHRDPANDCAFHSS